jgi:hypothetical protein
VHRAPEVDPDPVKETQVRNLLSAPNHIPYGGWQGKAAQTTRAVEPHLQSTNHGIWGADIADSRQ